MVRVGVMLLLGLVCFATASHTSPVQEPIYPLEVLVEKADNIIIGQVIAITEKMENLALDGVVSPLLVVTAHFREVEVLRGDSKKTSIRQYSAFANTWRKGARLMVFSLKPTELGFEPVLRPGILEIKGENAHGYIVYQGGMRRSIPVQKIRELINASNPR